MNPNQDTSKSAPQGKSYYIYEEDFLKDIQEANTKLHAYNHLPPHPKADKNAFLRTLIDIPEDGCILSPFHCDFGFNIHIGKSFFANVNLVVLDAAEVRMGDHVFIGPNVGIYTVNHPLDVERRNAGLEFAYPVTIGNNVWIGGSSVILPGVTIGDNAVIAAGSVVNADVPANALVAGNPCRLVRFIDQAAEQSRQDYCSVRKL